MNRRITIEMPEEMHRLISQYAEEDGMTLEDYVLAIINKHIEDVQNIITAKAELERTDRGEDGTDPVKEV